MRWLMELGAVLLAGATITGTPETWSVLDTRVSALDKIADIRQSPDNWLQWREWRRRCRGGRRRGVRPDSDGCADPLLDGFEATRRIREREGHSGSRVPIVAMTAHAMQGDRERCLAAGMDDYLAKPLQPKALLTLLEQVVRGDVAAAVLSA